jgi:hypothetical protein
LTARDIRQRVQERLRSGRLRRAYHHLVITPRTTAGGRSPSELVDDPCAVCDGFATPIKYNVEGLSYPVAFHRECHEVWREEAEKPVRRRA